MCRGAGLRFRTAVVCVCVCVCVCVGGWVGGCVVCKLCPGEP